MKNTALAIALAICALATFTATEAEAQMRQQTGAAVKATGAPLKLKQISKPGTACLVPTPEFDGKVKSPGRTSRQKKRWAQFEVEYITSPDWIDAVTFTFHVMSVDDEKVFHYYNATVTYVDIAKGEHGACVMLPPSAVLRYGTPVAFGVEIELDGKTIVTESEGMGKGTPWWARLDAMESKGKIERHSGILQDRSNTPFGLTYIDEYEVVR